MNVIVYKGYRILRIDGDESYFVDLGNYYVDGLESIADARRCIDRHLHGNCQPQENPSATPSPAKL